jgi:hypothetical protein
VIGNVVAAVASSQKTTFEPLPFTNYSLFEERQGMTFFEIEILTSVI